MSNISVATLPRITALALSTILLSDQFSNVDASTPPLSLAIIDVRDDDYIGGHIIHSMHVPSATLAHKIPELVRKLKDKETVVFHCALSQVRGPSAALLYCRERERLLGIVPREGQDTEKWGEREAGRVKEQKVYVLADGFVGWVQLYGEDVRLTEGYRKEIWQDGYDY